MRMGRFFLPTIEDRDIGRFTPILPYDLAHFGQAPGQRRPGLTLARIRPEEGGQRIATLGLPGRRQIDQ